MSKSQSRRLNLTFTQIMEAERLLRDEGWPYTEVAKHFEVGRMALAQQIPGYGLSKKETSQLGVATRKANAKARKRGEYV